MARTPSADEFRAIRMLLESERTRYRDDVAAAEKAATQPLGPLPDGVEAAEAAAWTSVCNVILNLDETLTKE